MPTRLSNMGYWVYMLRCRDDTLYTGSTTDPERRLAVHQSGKGAKYTRSRLPVELVYREELADKSAALRREAAIKKMSRAEKLQLIRTTQKITDCLTMGSQSPTRGDYAKDSLPPEG